MNANTPRHIGMAGVPLSAAKDLLGGMSLNGQAIPVGGITLRSMPKLLEPKRRPRKGIAREFRHGLRVGVNKGTTGMPVGLFSMLLKNYPLTIF